ncbi:TIGR02206 family membrane protein [Hoyosella altamirensis]|uniref:Putative integral membrane protein (TIGR02206 family) n=1 Tax=Hoyosella altamirensis TaxID=616997 RepID=A0A839RRN8_9ACTN|nr:TIGR02206 family membrane protein [Hoyosella altamirensis]MBB3038541.1 putative integral membrane protein (TIGR02206 family) [Hoyosella altamirensis]
MGDGAPNDFTAYGPSHWFVLGIFALGAVLSVWIGRRERGEKSSLFSRGFGLTVFVLYVVMMSVLFLPPAIDQSVPLRLTDLATVIAAYALWSRRQWAYALTYYWCLVLSTQALVTPALESPDFPHPHFLAFWAIHLVVVWAAIYLTWGVGMRPDWGSFRTVVAVTLTWAVVTMTFNSLAGTNYGFLNAKPSTPSLLDAFGPWPWYIVVAGSLIVAIWALMTWPWVRGARQLERRRNH